MNKEEKSITIFDLIRVVKKNILLIIIVTCSVAILGIAYTLFNVQETYKATSSMTVQVPTEKGVDDLPNSLKYVNTVADLILDYGTLKHVVSEYNTKESANENYQLITVSSLKSMIKTSANPDSLYVTFTIVDSNKTRIVSLSNYIMNYIKSMENDNNPNTSDDLMANITIKSVPVSLEDVAYNSPNKLLYFAISCFLGVAISFGIVFIKEFASSKCKTKEDIEQFGYDIAGVFFDAKSAKNGVKNSNMVETNEIDYEPYNKLINVVKYSNIDKEMKVIMVSSTGMDELKTTTTCNLALTAVNNGKKVLIMDLDLRKPSVHKAFKVSREQGLTEIIGSDIDIEKGIKHTSSGVDIITAGKSVGNPLLLMGTNKISSLIKELREKYDYIFIDSAPLLVCNDSLMVIKDIDGILFNVAINQMKKKVISECLTTFRKVEANIIGINIVKYKASKSENYSYYNYKNYYNTDVSK